MVLTGVLLLVFKVVFLLRASRLQYCTPDRARARADLRSSVKVSAQRNRRERLSIAVDQNNSL